MPLPPVAAGVVFSLAALLPILEGSKILSGRDLSNVATAVERRIMDQMPRERKAKMHEELAQFDNLEKAKKEQKTHEYMKDNRKTDITAAIVKQELLNAIKTKEKEDKPDPNTSHIRKAVIEKIALEIAILRERATYPDYLSAQADAVAAARIGAEANALKLFLTNPDSIIGQCCKKGTGTAVCRRKSSFRRSPSTKLKK